MSFFLVYDTEACRLANNIKDNGVSYVAYYRSDTEEIDGFYEKDVPKLKKLFDEADYIVGYNIIGYDFPVLEKYFDFDIKSYKTVDLFLLLCKQHKLYLKLDNVAEHTLNKNKIATGLDAVRFYNEGRLKELKEYCDQDVKVTTDVYYYLLDKGYVKYKDGVGNIKQLALELPDFVRDGSQNTKIEPVGLF